MKRDPPRIATIEDGRQRAGRRAPRPRSAFDLDVLRADLAGWSTADWGVWASTRRSATMTIERQLDEFHVGHVEQHLDQLDGLRVRERA